MITYKEFAEGLVPYIKEAEGLKSASALDKDPNFRKWRHRVTELINLIEVQNYRVNCNIHIRRFRGQGDALSKIEGYARDLNDTIIELKTIFDNYCAYGVPKKIETTTESNLIKPGLIPTTKELLSSLPFDKVWKLVTAIIALIVLLLGIGFEAGKFYQKHFSVESKSVIKDESAK